MVPNQIDQREAVEEEPTSKIVLLGLIGVLVATVTLVGAYLIHGLISTTPQPEPEPEALVDGPNDVIEEPELELVIQPVDFQPIVDEWAESSGGNRSVLIYDLELDKIVGSYNVDERYSTASLYKLFVVYEGYIRVNSGEWDGNEIAGSTRHTILECLDLAIRESNSSCAETLWGMIGHSELDEIIENDFDIHNADISRLSAYPENILDIMKLFYLHPDISDESLIAQMKDSFLIQPTTNYNWRQGLPSGFSRADVYNKVGWDWNGSSWNIYHDAAIVEFPEDDRHFIVVVMTNRVPYQKIRNFGTMLENAYYSD